MPDLLEQHSTNNGTHSVVRMTCGGEGIGLQIITISTNLISRL